MEFNDKQIDDFFHNAVQIGTEWYISMQLIMENPQQTISQCVSFTPPVNKTIIDAVIPSKQKIQLKHAIKKYSRTNTQYQDDDSDDRFRWNEKPSQIFTLIVTAIGVTKVKPKILEKFFPSSYGLNSQMLGSHLQKYKQKLAKQYNVHINQLNNWMVPSEFNTGDVARCAKCWNDKTYSGCSQVDVMSLLIDF